MTSRGNPHARLGTHEYENWILSSKYLFRVTISLIRRRAEKRRKAIPF